MTPRIRTVRDETGVALPLALFALVMLSGLLLAFLSMAGMEPVIAQNHASSSRAFYIADAGIEHAKQELLTANINKILKSNPPVINFAVGGNPRSFGGGTYSVTVDNNAADPGGPNNDTDNVILVTSTGTFQNAPRTIEAMFRVFQGGVDFPGAITVIDGGGADRFRANLIGGNLLVQGQDTQAPSFSSAANIPSGCSAPPTGTNLLGISLSSQASANELTSTVSAQKADKVTGLKPGSTTNEYTANRSWGYNNGAGQEFSVTADDLRALVKALRARATVLPPNETPGDLGSPTEPGIWISDGALTLTNNSKGYGILVVNATDTLSNWFSMRGGAQWEGLIIVVGQGYANLGGDGTKVYGAMFVANTLGGQTALDISGQGNVNYSSQALCRVKGLLQGTQLLAWRER